MKNRTGFELPIGILATYFIFKLWWAGWFQDASIEMLASYWPRFLTSDGVQPLAAGQLYGTSVFGTLFIETINLLVGIGTVVIWLISGAWAVLKDIISGTSEGIGFTRKLQWPAWDFWTKKPVTPPVSDSPEATPEATPEPIVDQDAARIAVANELVSAALDGSQSRLIAAAEMLHGEKFVIPAEPPVKKPARPSRRKTT